MGLDTHLVALTPADVGPAQQQIATFCDQRIRELSQEKSDLLDSQRIADQNGWKSDHFLRLIAKAVGRIVYYEKVKAAVQAGYLIVPNFDVEVMAVRVLRDARRLTASHANAQITNATAELLPVGEGRYVDDKQVYDSHAWKESDGKGGFVTKQRFTVAGFDDEIDFPVTAVKPAILDATARAMALKIFDRIGVVTGRQEDPIVLGQILDPRGSRQDQHWRRTKRVSFFIAWWLDPGVL